MIPRARFRAEVGADEIRDKGPEYRPWPMPERYGEMQGKADAGSAVFSFTPAPREQSIKTSYHDRRPVGQYLSIVRQKRLDKSSFRSYISIEFNHGKDENVLSDNSRRNWYCTAPEKKNCQGTSQVVTRKWNALRIRFLRQVISHDKVLFFFVSIVMKTDP